MLPMYEKAGAYLVDQKLEDSLKRAPWQVYIIQTHKAALYTGITTNLSRRYTEHEDVYAGKIKARGAKFFRSHKPVAIVFARGVGSRSEASRLEYQLKQMTKLEKLRLIEAFRATNHLIR